MSGNYRNFPPSTRYKGYHAWSSFREHEWRFVKELHLSPWYFFLNEVIVVPFSEHTNAKSLLKEFPEALGIIRYGKSIIVVIVGRHSE